MSFILKQTYIAMETEGARLVGVYWAPSLSAESLDESLRNIERLQDGTSKPTLVLGDLDARFGEAVGDSAWNPRGHTSSWDGG